MNRLLFLAALLLTLLVDNPVFSADFQKGEEAYDKGDYATAFREFKPLAEQGDAIAQYNLGYFYTYGLGVPQDHKAAVKCYARAAEQENAVAQYSLGWMYETGRGVPRDYETAVKWYKRAAEQGVASAQYGLGVMYALGQGTLRNYTLAHMRLSLAASQGDANARINRDIAEKNISPAQLETAKKLARECVQKNYQGC